VVRRWRRWSEHGVSIGVVVAVLVVGIIAESRAPGLTKPDLWLPDLAAGMVVAVTGVVLLEHDAEPVGWLMAAAGLMWFAGNFRFESTVWVAWPAGHFGFVHRAIMFQAMVSFPFGRLRTTLERAVVIFAYLAAVADVVAPSGWWTIIWVSTALAMFVLVVRSRNALVRAAGFHVLPAMIVFWVVLVSSATMRLTLGFAPPPRIIELTYQAGIGITAVYLGILASQWSQRAVDLADAVVELTFGPAGNVRDLLSQALRDPSVDVVFAVSNGETTSWVDEAGRPATALSATSRTVVPLVVDGRVAAQFASAVDIETFPALRTAVESATLVAARHARLRSELRTQIDLLAASRLRLVSVADEQRADLAGQLEREAGTTLSRVRDVVTGLADVTDQDVSDAVARSVARLHSLTSDLDSIAAGLGPATLHNGGLDKAFHRLAASDEPSIAVAVTGSLDGLSSTTASTIYFVCAEAVVNAVKHANATTVRVTLESDADGLRLRVVDDGRGGADMSAGSGIQHLVDRVSALGGVLQLHSPAGAGTLLIAELPSGAQQS
jgi:signal transduction histidine kinase